MNDMECLDNLCKNIEVERVKLGYSQAQMAKAIGMSLSSYKRMLAGEMNLRASIVLKNLYFLTGKSCWEFMELHSPILDVSKKLRLLNPSQLAAVNTIIDLFIAN